MEWNATAYWEKFINELRQFCDSKEQIYIYGAGKYAKAFYRFLRRHNFNIRGFFVTEENKTNYEEKPIVCIDSVIDKLDYTVGVILAMKFLYQDEVRKVYGKKFRQKQVELFSIDEYMLSLLCIWEMDDCVEEWRKQFACTQEIKKNSWKNILIIHLEYLIGDYIWGTAFLRELRANFPNEHITYVVNQKMYDLFINCPYVDEIIQYDCQTVLYSQKLESKIKEFAKDNFYGHEYDVVFLVKAIPCHERDAIENVLLALYSQAKTRVAHGFNVFLQEIVYTDFWKELFPIMAINDKAEHDVSKDLSLLRVCDLVIQDQSMELWTSVDEKRWARNLVDRYAVKDDAIIIALGVAGREERRSWPAECYYELIRRLEMKNPRLCFVIFGGENAVGAAEVISESSTKIINLAGKTTLAQSIAVMEQCDLYVGSDTSLMHMAAAFGHPIVELTANLKDGCDIDRGHPTRTGPWKVPGKVVYPRKQLDDCTHVCMKPYAHCITQIAVDEVKEAVIDMIEKYCNKGKMRCD